MLRWTVAVSTLAVCSVTISTARKDDPPAIREAKPIHLAREAMPQVLARAPRRSDWASRARAIRTSLVGLRVALDALEVDPSSDRLSEVLGHRDAIARAFRELTKKDRSGSPSTGMAKIEKAMRSLQREVDEVVADPIGQRARIASAKEQIDFALRNPQTETPRVIRFKWLKQGAG